MSPLRGFRLFIFDVFYSNIIPSGLKSRRGEIYIENKSLVMPNPGGVTLKIYLLVTFIALHYKSAK